MSRGLIRRLLIAVVATPMIAQGLHGAADPAGATEALPAVLQRFLSLDDADPDSYRALRRLEARNDRQVVTAWMDVWTEKDDAGEFSYTIAAQGGSTLIRSKVFIASLEAEKKMWRTGEPGRAALTPDNYQFQQGEPAGGLSALAVTPRRKDVLLIDGAIFLRPETGDLVRLEGRLSKAPSFWIQQVDVVRCYERIAGVRLPVSFDAVAKVRLAGRNSFRMTYEYATVNGRRVGAPGERLASVRP